MENVMGEGKGFDRDSEVCFIFVCSTDILQRREAFEVCMIYSGLMLN